MKKMLSIVATVTLCGSLSACMTTAEHDNRPVKPVSSLPAVTIHPHVVEQQTDNTAITIEQIMSDPQWIGRTPVRPGWSIDGKKIVYEQPIENSNLYTVFAAPVTSPKNVKPVPLSEIYQYRFDERAVSPDGDVTVFRVDNSVFVLNGENNIVQLTRGGEALRGIGFMTDGRITARVGNSIIAMNIETGQREVLLSWAFSDKPEAVTPARDYIAKEQQALIYYVAEQRRLREAASQREQDIRQVSPAYAPETIYFNKNDRLVSASVSPDGAYAIIATTENRATSADTDIMPHYIQEDGRIAALRVRQRVADSEQVQHDVWLVNLTSGKKSKLSYLSLPGYNEDVLASVKAENAAARGESYQVNRLPRKIRLFSSRNFNNPSIRWHESGKHVALMLEAADNKDRWIVSVDFKNSAFEVMERLHDDAWINYSHNQFGWLKQSATLFYQSEQDGYSHLYLQKPGEAPKQITRGQFVVESPSLSRDDAFIYYTANKKHPGIYEVYRVSTQTGESEALTDLNGITDYRLSPDNRTLLLTHSKVNRPPELYIKPTVPDTPAKQITTTVSETFLSLPWAVPQVVAIPSSHSKQPIYARIYLPDNYMEGPARKAVVFNHGAGYLQNAHLGWSDYFREYMFNSMLVQQGYVVMDMDYRASKGYGRDWRTAIYRQMGTPEVEDLQDGVNWLVENANVDVNRIGTYGGSYGGFLTFMSMFKKPELFAAGAALRPVSDWAHYNYGYTSNILNTPDVDPIAFKRSSPIYFAEGLQKPLLIIAPMVDNNVFFQDSVRLVQRLIELEKTDFETAIYPVEPHGFVQPSSWLDEYRRIYKLFETNL